MANITEKPIQLTHYQKYKTSIISYRKRNPEKVKEIRKRYYENNKDKSDLQHKMYLSDPIKRQRYNEYHRLYNQINREKYNEYRKYYQQYNQVKNDDLLIDRSAHTNDDDLYNDQLIC